MTAVSRHQHPLGLRPGDVVSPLFNPLLQVTVSEVALSTLAAAMPGQYNPDLPGDTKVRLVFGTNTRTGEPARLVVDVGSDVRLHLRDGQTVGD